MYIATLLIYFNFIIIWKIDECEKENPAKITKGK